MDLSIAIVSWNTRGLLDECLKSIFETTQGIEFAVVVVDNASSDGSQEMVREKYPQVRLIENTGNVGFSRANNQAYEAVESEFFLLLNPDTVVRGDAMKRMTDFLRDNPKAGAVGPLVLNDDGSLQYSWAKFPTVWSEAMGRLDRSIDGLAQAPITADEVRALEPFPTGWVGGCAMMVRREAARQTGLMDESLFMYCEETDWCLRLDRAGWGIWVEPRAEIVHYGGKSSEQASESSRRQLIASKASYFRKHFGLGASVAVYTALSLRSYLRKIRSVGAA